MHARIWRGITCDLFDGGLKMAEECEVDEGGWPGPDSDVDVGSS